MSAPVCVKCSVRMTPAKIGVYLELMAGKEGYQVWSGDRFACPECGAAVVSGFGSKPVAEHFQSKYASFAEGAQRFWETLKEKAEGKS